jgi:tyrosine-protein phosphatase YwqE
MLGMKHKLPEGFFQGACDMHCHLLPGVDDGFPTAELSLQALQKLEQQGVMKMIFTPHFMKEYPDNNRANIMAKFEMFKAEAKNHSKMELRLAAEYMLDARFLEHFKQGFLTLDKQGTHVLCETSYMMYEHNVAEMLYEIMLDGFQPVIAHPERYEYASKGHYFKWKDKRYKFQLNLLSLGGAYGGPAAAKAHFLLKEGMYDYVGSDLHKWDTFVRFSSQIKLGKKDIDRVAQLLENNKELFG